MKRKKKGLLASWSVFLLLGLIVLFSYQLVGGANNGHSAPNPLTPTPTVSGETYVIVTNPPGANRQSLQIDTINFSKVIVPTPTSAAPINRVPTATGIPPTPTITPTPTSSLPYCPRDAQRPPKDVCQCPVGTRDDTIMCPASDFPNGCPYGQEGVKGGDVGWCAYYPEDLHYESMKLQYIPPCQIGCWGKPVIYLYPLVDTLVNVKITIPGYVYKSIPTYNTNVAGWQNVLAHPGGSLTYQGKEYNELYYESAVTKHVAPKSGVTIPKNELKEKLLLYTHQLGLKPTEQQEFLDYWLPKLNEINTPYIFFSVLTPKQKDSVDYVQISPRPTTFIDFLVYFKGVNQQGKDTLELPATPPQRIGFTAVEWGGTIDR